MLTGLVQARGVGGKRHSLVDLVVAARRFGRIDWLRDKVACDAESSSPLRQRRAAFVEPLLGIPAIAPANDWPSDEHADGVRGASWKLGQQEAYG